MPAGVIRNPPAAAFFRANGAVFLVGLGRGLNVAVW